MRKGIRKIAVRYSQYEPLEFVAKFQDTVDWVWVDCFDGLPPETETLKRLGEMFKICLVSPELQGYSEEYLRRYNDAIKDLRIDAVCTKKPDLWT